MKYSDLHADPDLRKTYLDHIEKRWKQLHDLDIKHGDAAINFLMIVSGGSAAATLTFIGNAMKDGPAPGGAVLMLGFFALSILFVGLLKARLVYHVRDIFQNWRGLTKAFFANEVEWNEMMGRDDDAVIRNANLAFYLGWAALACWAAGVIVGFIKLQEDPSNGRKETADCTQTVATAAASATSEAAGEGLGIGIVRPRQEIEQHRDGAGNAPTPTAAEEEVTASPDATTTNSSPPVPASAPSNGQPRPPSN